MYQNFNEQFAAASRQFVDSAAQVNRLALENAEKVFGLQLAAFEESANATFAFLGEVAEVRDFDDVILRFSGLPVRYTRRRAKSSSTECQKLVGLAATRSLPLPVLGRDPVAHAPGSGP